MSRFMRPTVYTGGIFEEIDPDRLLYDIKRATGEAPQGVAADLDSTITAQEASEPSPKSLAVARRLAELLPFVLISNAGEERHHRVLDYARQIGSDAQGVTSHETGRRKPSKVPFHEASRRLGVPNRGMIHIGDQPMKDVLGANRAGYGASVLVEPCAPQDDPESVRRFQRAPEAIALELMGITYGTPYIDDHGTRVVSAGYRRMRNICTASALSFAAAAGIEGIVQPDWRGALAGGFSLALALGLADSAAAAHDFAKRQEVIEGMTRLIDWQQAEQTLGTRTE